MKRISRDRRLTPEEAAKYKALRERVAEELPELIARHHDRMTTLERLQELAGRAGVGEEFHSHQGNPPESAGGGPCGNAE